MTKTTNIKLKHNGGVINITAGYGVSKSKPKPSLLTRLSRWWRDRKRAYRHSFHSATTKPESKRVQDRRRRQRSK